MMLLVWLALAVSPDEPLVRVLDVIPDAVVELRYATPRNLAGAAIYPPEAECLLLPLVAERLSLAAEELRRRGFRLLLWDCYRPTSLHRKLWEMLPNSGWVADPNRGSQHSRGAAVDVALADADGRAVEMPTDFDVFIAATRRDAPGVSKVARAHRKLLRRAMERAGFENYVREWWHFSLRVHPLPPQRDEPLFEVER